MMAPSTHVFHCSSSLSCLQGFGADYLSIIFLPRCCAREGGEVSQQQLIRIRWSNSEKDAKRREEYDGVGFGRIGPRLEVLQHKQQQLEPWWKRKDQVQRVRLVRDLENGLKAPEHTISDFIPQLKRKTKRRTY